MSSAAVRFTNATARVGARTVWRDVNLRIPCGDFVAVLGPNGVGKSTLIRAALGLHPLAAGEVRLLDGPPEETRERVGYLPQRHSFDPSIRVRGADVVRLGADGDKWGLPRPWTAESRRTKARVTEVIDQVGAAAYADRPIGEMSGGEQQRLLIAQALVRRPEVLILDEPLDSLDLPNQATVAALVNDLCRAEGITVVLVAHDVNPILPYLDQVVYLGHGGAVCGPPSEVVTSDTLSRLYDAAVEVLTTSDGRLVVVGQPEAPAHHHDRHAH